MIPCLYLRLCKLSIQYDGNLLTGSLVQDRNFAERRAYLTSPFRCLNTFVKKHGESILLLTITAGAFVIAQSNFYYNKTKRKNFSINVYKNTHLYFQVRKAILAHSRKFVVRICGQMINSAPGSAPIFRYPLNKTIDLAYISHTPNRYLEPHTLYQHFVLMLGLQAHASLLKQNLPPELTLRTMSWLWGGSPFRFLCYGSAGAKAFGATLIQQLAIHSLKHPLLLGPMH